MTVFSHEQHELVELRGRHLRVVTEPRANLSVSDAKMEQNM